MTGTSRYSTKAWRPWSGSGSRPTKAESRVAILPGPTGDSHPHSIHRSAWKRNSANFALTEFYEARPRRWALPRGWTRLLYLLLLAHHDRPYCNHLARF